MRLVGIHATAYNWPRADGCAESQMQTHSYTKKTMPNIIPPKPEEHIESSIADDQDNFVMLRGERAFLWIAGLFLISLILYFVRFGIPFFYGVWNSIDRTDYFIANLSGTDAWGTFGDFLGGLLNPAVGIVTVYLVLMNVRMQKKELGYALREMKNSNAALAKQNFAIEQQGIQNTFFQWLTAYRGIISGLKFSFSEDPNAAGLKVLEQLYNEQFHTGRISQRIADAGFSQFADAYIRRERIEDRAAIVAIDQAIMEQWELVLKSYNYLLLPALKSLSGLIIWITRQHPEYIDEHKKSEYIDIISSHLSQVEAKFLLLYAYNEDHGLLKQLRDLGFFHEIKFLNDANFDFLFNFGRFIDLGE